MMQQAWALAMLSTLGAALPSPDNSSPTTSAESAHKTPNIMHDAALCDNGNMNKTAWDYYNMDKYTKFIADEYPTNFMNNGKDVPKDADFVQYLATVTGNIGNNRCQVNYECDIDVSDIGGCSSDNYLEPAVYFYLDALKNFYDWQAGSRKALKEQGQEFSSKATKMVEQFTDHDLSTSSEQSAMTVMTSVFLMLAPLMTECPECVELFGLATSGTIVGSNILSASQTSAAEVLQEELDHIASLQDAINNVTTVIDKAYERLAVGVLNTKPDNSREKVMKGQQWSTLSSSAPAVLKGGVFSQQMNWKDYDILKDKFYNLLATSSISQCWSMDSVFIVKATSKTKGVAPADLKLDHLGSDSRECDGDTCYFFIMNQKIKNLSPWSKWETVKGLDKVKNYGTSLKSIAKAADWFQSKFGSYQKVPDVKTTLSSIQDKDSPPDNLWINLPVIDYDNGPSLGFGEHYGGGSKDPESEFLSTIAKYINELNGWPYEKMTG